MAGSMLKKVQASLHRRDRTGCPSNNIDDLTAQGCASQSGSSNGSLIADQQNVQSSAAFQRAPTLKRKAGSPNLTSQQFQKSLPFNDSVHAPTPNVTDHSLQASSWYSRAQQPNHLHSIASDLDGCPTRITRSNAIQEEYRQSLKDISNVYKSDARPTPIVTQPYHSSSQDSIDCESCSSRHELHALQHENGQTFPTTNLPSDASIPSISRFPLPPYASKQEQIPTDNPIIGNKSPTIYHFRGASFEFVNPRNSLLLQDIETPAELDPDNLEYFSHLKGRRNYIFHESEQTMESPLTECEINKGNSRPTPPRSLFDDLPSAYQSITCKNTPAVGRSPPGASEEYRSLAQSSPVASVVKTPKAKTPYSQRLFTPDAEQAVQRPLPVAHIGGKYPHFSKTNNPTRGKFAFENGQVSHDAQPSSDEEVGLVEGRLLTPIKSRLSTSRLSGYSTEFEHDDDSTGDLIASYSYDREADRFPHSVSNLSRQVSLPPRAKNSPFQAPNTHTESTIGEILEQYHRQDTFGWNAESYFDTFKQRSASLPNFGPQDITQIKDAGATQTAKAVRNATAPAESNGLSSSPKDLRMATARALKLPSKTGPCLALPKTPTSRLLQPITSSDRNDISKTSSSPSGLSYGDTHQLLLLSRSQSSAETRREVFELQARKADRVQSDTSLSPSIAIKYADSDKPVPSMETNECRESQQSFEDILNRDIKYLRRISGLSEFQGSVYVIGGKGNSVQGQDAQDRNINTQPKTADGTNIAPRRISKPPVEAAWVPVAAFQQNSVVPGIFRLPTAERGGLDKPSDAAYVKPDFRPDFNPFDDGERETTEDGDLAEWETLPESMATLQNEGKSDTSGSGDWSSYCSDDPSQCLPAHPVNRASVLTKHKDNSPTIKGPAFEPSYEFKSSQASRQDTPMSVATPLYNTYKHPVPLSKALENPFTSSPPQIAGPPRGGTPTTFRTKPSTISKISTKENENLSLVRVGYQFHPVAQEAREKMISCKDPFNPSRISGTEWNAMQSPLSHHDSSAWLSTEPGPEISLEAEHGSPMELNRNKMKPKTTFLSSGLDASLMRTLRKDDPRMVSSPLSRSNSFRKLSCLGPKANITGTPDGTGMREVGSSIIGSSPFGAAASSPAGVQFTSPLSRTTDAKWNAVHRCSQHISHHFPQDNLGTDEYPFDSVPEAGKKEPVDSFRDAIVEENRTTYASMDALESQHSDAELNSMLRRAETTLAPIRLPPPVICSHLPKLHRRYRSPSSRGSQTRLRKQRLSWALFGVCSILPYMLILYGHGAFDVAMMHWTDGEIEHCGRRQKTLAKIIGWGSAAATIFVVVILFIIIRTVPNNFSR